MIRTLGRWLRAGYWLIAWPPVAPVREVRVQIGDSPQYGPQLRSGLIVERPVNRRLP